MDVKFIAILVYLQYLTFCSTLCLFLFLAVVKIDFFFIEAIAKNDQSQWDRISW